MDSKEQRFNFKVHKRAVCLLACLSLTSAFLVDNGDETLQTALNAILQLNTRLNELQAENSQLRHSLASLTQTVSRLPASRLLSDFVWYDDWALVFRATAGIGRATYDTYVNRGHHDDDPETRVSVPCGCTTVNGSLPCDRHYRSRLLDSWPSSAIDQVRLALYENGVEKEHITFSGQGSDYLSWFSGTRVLESSWSDLYSTGSYVYFSIPGDAANARRFEIMQTYHGCPGDVGWLTVKELPTDGCAWGTHTPAPTFIYAPNGQGIAFANSGFRYADVMAIFVKFRSNADLTQMCLV